MERRKELDDIFKDIEENEKKLIDPLIDEVVFLEKQMNDLKEVPFINYHPKNPSLQKKTEAAKLYKEFSQSYMNAIRILCSLLNKIDSNAKDDLLKKLEEFM